MKTTLISSTARYLASLFLLVPHAGWAEPGPEALTSVSALQVQETGVIKLPPGFRHAAWVDVMSSVHLLPDATERLHTALNSQGFIFAASESAASASVIITGHVRLYNPDKSYDSGKVFLGELIEARAHRGDGRLNRSSTSGRGPLDYDAGVAHQGQRLLTQAGVPGGILAGIAFAIVTDWLVDSTGVRAAIAEGFESSPNTQSSPSGVDTLKAEVEPAPYKFKARQWFCGESCKRTIHVAEITASVWQGQTQLSSYSITLSKELPDKDESTIRPLIDAGLGRTIEKLLEAAAQ